MDKNKTTRPPGRKLTKEDLARVIGGNELLNGCCSQGCCCSPALDETS